MAQKNRNENPHTTISTLFSFFVFRFFKFFWPTKIWRIFCHRNKICGSTELKKASRSHFRPHHTDSCHKFRFVRGTTIVLGSSKQMWCLPSASIRLFECPNRGFQFLRCFFSKKRGLRCFFPKPYFTFLDVISPYLVWFITPTFHSWCDRGLVYSINRSTRNHETYA